MTFNASAATVLDHKYASEPQVVLLEAKKDYGRQERTNIYSNTGNSDRLYVRCWLMVDSLKHRLRGRQ